MIKKLLALMPVLFAIPLVYANENLENIPIPDFIFTLINLVWSGDPEAVYLRFIIFVASAVIFNTILKNTFFSKSSKNSPSIILSMILGLIATISLSATVVELIFDMYSGIFGLLLLLGPPLWIIYQIYTKIPGNNWFEHLTRALALLIMSVLLTSKTILESFEFLEDIGVAAYIMLFGSILFGFAIYEGFLAFSGRHSSNSSASSGSSAGFNSSPSSNNARQSNMSQIAKSFGSALQSAFNKEQKEESNLAKEEKESVEETKKLEDYEKYLTELGEVLEKIEKAPEKDKKINTDKVKELLKNILNNKILPDLNNFKKNYENEADSILSIEDTHKSVKEYCENIIKSKDFKDNEEFRSKVEKVLEDISKTEINEKKINEILKEFNENVASYKNIENDVDNITNNSKDINIQTLKNEVKIIKDRLEGTIKLFNANTELIDEYMTLQQNLVEKEEELKESAIKEYEKSKQS